jgi:hypothetical protein
VVSRVSPVNDSLVESPDRNAGVRPQVRPPDWKPIEELLGLVARALQQLHTYPATSPLCVSAIDACQRALAALDREQLNFRVTPSELLVDDLPIGRGTQVGHELARRLHRASVASVTLERGTSARELARFCEDLLRVGERTNTGPTLVDLLNEHGVDRIALEVASRPEVLEVGVVPETAAADMQRERARFDAQLAKGGRINHLYPPQKGWVRVDSTAVPASMSLLDLAVLADDPATLASMLLRLTDDVADVPPAEALEKKYSDVAMLISSLDPRVARRMFGKLARAVLDLEPGARQALLRRTVLPGLLDGRVDGTILRDFPDIDLAESLCLLLDLETAAPELLTTALSKLDLPADRHAAMVPLLDARLKERQDSGGQQTTLTRHARDLVRVEAGQSKNFADFAAFDLSLDHSAAGVLEHIRLAVPSTDILIGQLTCLWHLICLEPNPEAVGRFFERSLALIAQLESSGRIHELPPWLANYRYLSDRLREARPDVSETLARYLAQFCTADRAAWIADVSLMEPHGKSAAAAMIDALGPALATPFVELLERDAERDGAGRQASARGRAVVQLITEHAALLAAALAPLLQGRTPGVRRLLLRTLGFSGPGWEESIAAYIADADEQTAREALRALARIGTAKAASLVVAEIERQPASRAAAAEETLWHFPASEAQRRTRELLGRRDFRLKHPEATERLLDRAARSGIGGLESVLVELAPMRFRIWNPALARVARKAHAMLKTTATA